MNNANLLRKLRVLKNFLCLRLVLNDYERDYVTLLKKNNATNMEIKSKITYFSH